MNMNLVLSGIAAIAISFSGFAEEESPSQVHKQLSREELIARRYTHTGGYVVKPNSQRGCVVVFNAQKTVTSPELSGVIKKIETKLGYKAEIREIEAVTIQDASKVKKDAKATVAVFVVEDATLPISLVSYEEHWGFVNIAKLADGADKVRLFGRANAETMRVLALASGAANSQFPMSLMKNLSTARALDGLDSELPYDVMNRMADTYNALGMTHEHKTTYRNACKEGWAPAPTNDVQQAIWDDVHASPTDPIKIKFEKK